MCFDTIREYIHSIFKTQYLFVTYVEGHIVSLRMVDVPCFVLRTRYLQVIPIGSGRRTFDRRAQPLGHRRLRV